MKVFSNSYFLLEAKMNNWKNVCVSTEDSIESVISVIDQGSLRIALVIDNEDHLLGTVTDGDIRRAFIKHFSPTSPVEKIMNRQPRVLQNGASRNQIKSIMDEFDLMHIPIVNETGQVVNLETLQSVSEKPKYDNPVFLMAGGFGTRLRPLTNDCPKPMLKVGQKPILETIIEGFRDGGFSNFYISVHYMPEKLIEYFGDGSDWGVKIRYIKEDEPIGTGGALGLLPHEDINKPILMMNGDLLTKVNFEHLLRFHHEESSLLTMCVREYDFQVPYGVIESSGTEITKIVEKPIHNFFVNAGIYVLDPSVVKSVNKNEHMDMPTLVEELISANKKVNMFPIYEYWLDIGQMQDFERAQVDIAKGEL